MKDTIAYTSIFVGLGIGLYIAQPTRKRPMARRLIMVLMGTLLLFIALVSHHGNMQIEGLFFAILLGTAPLYHRALFDGENCGAAYLWPDLVWLGVLVRDGF